MASPSADVKPETLPYNLKTLSWDSMHHFNANNKYSYSGKGRKLGDPVLQCDVCEQWFHLKEVACVPKEAAFVPFQRNYRFSCRVCTGAAEQFELQTNTWTSIVLTALYNLLLTDDGTSLAAGVWIKVADIVTWIQEHWGSLTSGRNLAQLLENAAVPKCLMYAQNAQTFTVSDDRSEVLLKHVAPSKLLLKPHVSSAVPGIVPIGKKAAAKPEPVDRGKKRGRGAKKDKEESSKEAKPSTTKAAPPAPNLSDIKLPEKYRLLPVPKNDTSAPQNPDVVQLSRSARAPQLGLREDRRGVACVATGYKGYRMVRATHGVASGTWYYEVKILDNQNGEDGHARLGWCTEAGDLNAPVGYDVNSYSYRDVNGTKFHESRGSDYGEAYGPGDVVGCLLQMGDPPASRRERQRISLKGVEYIVEEERQRTESTGSRITFFRNGKSQGAAFENVWAEVYYPAASLYKSATVEVNFGPDFAYPPPPELEARPCCELAAAEKATLARGGSADAGAGADGMFGDARQMASAAAAEAGTAAAADDDEGEEGEEGEDEMMLGEEDDA